MERTHLLITVALAVLFTGCASREPNAPTSLTNAEVITDDTPRPFHVTLGPSVQDACKEPSPFFDYDAARTEPVEHPRLSAVASCMISGPLQGRTLRLVGNRARAMQVRNYLVARGIDARRALIVETKRTGDANDRRVELVLSSP